ncbi:histidinol-phosphate transaminase [Sinisalibacter aestuarii]|uniref:Histidinol-phosphate aminotransferase n=1 Tax=Sinisalibacter aestuarii TaxID=2949426 RepID=A0ABQ5LVT7_9RHOB|nr:histidinol-phosphate transaminase [Sinisalibacter aestuarii]GKY88376.1 histidinol-phosphate aminotransferase [Sinisalibacter aestuarii]
MSNGPTPQPGIMEIELYVSGSSKVDGIENVIKLSSNENPWGPSPKAIEALTRATHELHRYPPTDHLPLRTAIGEVHGLAPDRIICGVGSDEILILIAQAYAGPGDEVIITEHGFSMYPIIAHGVGAAPVIVPERERVVDVDAILAGVTGRTRLVFIANPANPTGTMVGKKELARLASALPPEVVLVLDGAYAEFVEGFDGGASLVDRFPNVVMTRTFSKIYGLGGLRLGWGYASREIIGVLNRLRNPFNLSTVQLAAGEAAMRDQDHVNRCRDDNIRLRNWLAHALAEHGVPSDTSSANFVLARFASAEEADAVDAHLKSEGVIVRKVAGYGLPHCLRITVGDEPSCRRVAHLIGQFKGAQADG